MLDVFMTKGLIYKTHILDRLHASLRAIGVAYGNTAAFLSSVLKRKQAIINRGSNVFARKIVHAKDTAFLS
jgi:hypothetical protein